MSSFRAMHFVLFFLLIASASAHSSSILLEEMLESHVASRNSRFRPPKPCPVDFEHKNYTLLTRTCRRPYKAEPCCIALQKIACPHMKDVNDMSTDCAISMFDSISYQGNYPPGLFLMLCSEGKRGMKCEG
ncbi:hypothetical protein R6Q59_004622 [Mikania micrantha]